MADDLRPSVVPPPDLSGRVALVTGGNRGIGRAVSLALAAQGATVAVNYRSDGEAAAETVDMIRRAGGLAQAYRASVGVRDEILGMVTSILDDFEFVDILVNNAGTMSRGCPVSATDATEVEQLLRVHAVGPHQLCRALLPLMRQRPRGDIVMVSSSATTQLAACGAPYSMAKAAMEALAHTLAKEERPHGIRVNIVAPGIVDTEMGQRLLRARLEVNDTRALDPEFPFGRICRSEDVAAAVAFLVSTSASYITGQRIIIDGGATADPPALFSEGIAASLRRAASQSAEPDRASR